jgi:hypothetical protein
MHGLINRSIQCFLRDTWGQSLWLAVARDVRLGSDGFEAMLVYDPALTEAVIDAAAMRLNRPRDSLLEDLGTYLVSHPTLEPVRRLLRFGGTDFVDFLHSLEDLPERGRLAVPDLDLPALALVDGGDGRFTLTLRSQLKGTGQIAVGLLRAMADDYGALVLLDMPDPQGDADCVTIHLLDTRFAAGRRFDLGVRTG